MHIFGQSHRSNCRCPRCRSQTLQIASARRRPSSAHRDPFEHFANHEAELSEASSQVKTIRDTLVYPIVRDPFEDETLEEYLAWHDDDPDGYGHYFKAKELTLLHKPINKPCTVESRKLPRYAVPPRRLWPRIIPTRQVVGFLRHRLGIPLKVGHGWRPKWYNKHVCGAGSSQHLYFAAMDVDLIGKYRKTHQKKLYEEAVKIYVAIGRDYQMGLGLYRSGGKGTRVHIDTGFRMRTWKPGYAKKVADRLGLKLP